MANHKSNQSPDRKSEAQKVDVSNDQQDPLGGNSNDMNRLRTRAPNAGDSKGMTASATVTML